jgi:hypothetical protein
MLRCVRSICCGALHHKKLSCTRTSKSKTVHTKATYMHLQPRQCISLRTNIMFKFQLSLNCPRCRSPVPCITEITFLTHSGYMFFPS